MLGNTGFSCFKGPTEQESEKNCKKFIRKVEGCLRTVGNIKTDVEDIKEKMNRLVRKKQSNPRKRKLLRLRVVNETLNYSQYTREHPQDFVSVIQDLNRQSSIDKSNDPFYQF